MGPVTTDPGTADPRRAALLQRRQELLGELDDIHRGLDGVVAIRANGQDDDEHDPDGAPLSGEWSRLETQRRSARERLAEVDSALGDLERGSYGVCRRCGNRIPEGRLEVRPATRFCVRCVDRR